MMTGVKNTWRRTCGKRTGRREEGRGGEGKRVKADDEWAKNRM